MAKCDQGYLCMVCGEEVAGIGESGLYLRFVIGLVELELLHQYPERHIRCDPILAQFITADEFPPVEVQGDMDKRLADPGSVRQQEELVTRGWQRLQELVSCRPPLIKDYPLPEVRVRFI